MPTKAQIDEQFDSARLAVSRKTSKEHKSAFGQFLTNTRIAHVMASLVTSDGFNSCKLLDPGAGLGALTAAFLERWKTGDLRFSHIDTTAYELDERLRGELCATISKYAQMRRISTRVIPGDFIEQAVLSIQGFGEERHRFTHAILNPPYKKIGSNSMHRHFFRKAGIETVNLYSGFVGLTIRLRKHMDKSSPSFREVSAMVRIIGRSATCF